LEDREVKGRVRMQADLSVTRKIRASVETVVELAGKSGVIPNAGDSINCFGTLRSGEHFQLTKRLIGHVGCGGYQAMHTGDHEPDTDYTIGCPEYDDTGFQSTRCGAESGMLFLG
jgi:hypothetical protein